MGHNGHPLLVGNMDKLPDPFRWLSRFCQYTEAIKIHNAGDHDLNKIRAVFPVADHQVRIFPQVLIAKADKASVVPFKAQRCQGRYIADAIFRRKPSRAGTDPPTVTAIPQVGISLLSVGFQGAADKGFVRSLPVPCDSGTPIDAVKKHVYMAVNFHRRLLS